MWTPERKLYLKAIGVGVAAFLLAGLIWMLWSDHQRLNLIDSVVGQLLQQAQHPAPPTPAGGS